MTLTNQQVFDGVQNYFIDRIENYRGKCYGGAWGSGTIPGNGSRCALGSLVQGTCFYVRDEVEKLLGIGNYFEWPENGLAKKIARFNDAHITDKTALNYEILNDFLLVTMCEFNLNYNNPAIKGNLRSFLDVSEA
jgi:hypothetical protein